MNEDDEHTRDGIAALVSLLLMIAAIVLAFIVGD